MPSLPWFVAMCFFVGVYAHHAALDAHRDVMLLKKHAQKRCVWANAWLYMWWAIEEVTTFAFQLMLLPAVIELFNIQSAAFMGGYLTGSAIGLTVWLGYGPIKISRRWEVYRQDTCFKGPSHV